MNEIALNVAKNGQHYCRIIIPNDLTINEATVRARYISILMGKEYEYQLTSYSTSGKFIPL